MHGRRTLPGLVARLLPALLALGLAGCALLEPLLPAPPVLTRDEAVAAARAAEPAWAAEDVMAAELGTWADLGEPAAPVEGAVPAGTDPVWRVTLGWRLGPLNGQGVMLLIDGTDGHVIQRMTWIS